ncbi:hypothetical protein Mmc1_0151 [Magnetococcus marinus MC-1]|uniref:N-acetyltransferase domain-containing protein n=1 Tax=Magnetococcus marinus (strain ATCC BAA-1437 / JCM 17883 / MC-1) TaxID=156889 RepID=A0L3Y5_MAGMM|nr:hypothetical protein [Magnetococcus marinus]ABK42678.1 hypothetical protein Mmc1_0151 [Magnetococcus marinus MC-1]
MSKVEIRRCEMHERDAVMAFIDEHWSKGHIMGNHTGLFEWQHRGVGRQGYDFMLAWRGSELLGVLGYITMTRFDAALAGRHGIWLALWKVREDCGVAGLGLALLRTLMQQEPHSWIGAVGINTAVMALYKALGFHTGQLSQYVLFHPTLVPQLAHRPRDFVAPTVPLGDAQLVPLHAAALQAWPDLNGQAVPAKSNRYLQSRYLEHPYYDYQLFGVVRGEQPVALLVARKVCHGGHCALRVVDYVGELHHLGACGGALSQQIVQQQCEYVDLWAHLPDTTPLQQAGLHRVDAQGELMVPNYFEPFEARNVCIYYAFKGEAQHRIWRGDGDQDRPNRLASTNK